MMSIQQRQIDFVQRFLAIKNESIISKLEDLLIQETDNSQFKPMSVEELNARIDRAMIDSENDNIISQKDLREKIKSW